MFGSESRFKLERPVEEAPCLAEVLGYVTAGLFSFICQLQLATRELNFFPKSVQVFVIGRKFYVSDIDFQSVMCICFLTFILILGPVLVSCITDIYIVHTTICYFICFCKMISLFFHLCDANGQYEKAFHFPLINYIVFL